MKTEQLPSVLVVDDESRSLESIQRLLGDNFQIFTAENTDDAFKILRNEWIQVLLCDQRMPGMTGVEFAEKVRRDYPNIVRMIISGYTDSNDIIDAINKGGIYQFIAKPWHPDELISKLNNAVELFRLQRENEQLTLELKLQPDTLEEALIEKRRTLKAQYDWDNSIVRGPESPMNVACNLIRQTAPYDVNVILIGESGTGKELCARALHYNSLRQNKPFIAENCAALPDQYLESELFGHKRGAFMGANQDRIGIFERANGGTIFLDEINDTSPAFQVKLLRVLQENEVRPLGSNRTRPVDVRIIASSSLSLDEPMKQGQFRDDLYFRLSTFKVEIPPLRERTEDIPLLASTLLHQAMDHLGKRVSGISEEALQCFAAYEWPGNVRELQNEIKRMLVLAQEDYLGSDLISPHILHATPEEDQDDMKILTNASGSLKERVDSLEARILKETLIRLRWNKSAAAQELGLSRVGLRNKMERLGLKKNNNIESLDGQAA